MKIKWRIIFPESEGIFEMKDDSTIEQIEDTVCDVASSLCELEYKIEGREYWDTLFVIDEEIKSFLDEKRKRNGNQI